MAASELRGERLRLVEPTVGIARRIWPIVRDEPGVLGPPGLAETEHELRHELERYAEQADSAERTRYRWTIELLATEEIIGSTRCTIEDRLEGQGSIGYALARAHRGRGYATDAVTLTLGFGFGVLDLHRIWATIEPDNEPSLRLVHKLGFRREGFLEKRIRVADEWRDVYLYAITADEWRAR